MIIRINLHPDRKVKTKSNPANAVLAICILLMIVIVGGFFVAAGDLDEEAKRHKRRASELQQQITEINSRISDIKTIRSKIEDMNNRQIVLARLASIRQGPQYVLNELARLLSNPRDILARKEAVEKGWLLAWEPENVMLRSFKDIGNSMIELQGTARSMEDIYEFWTRMKTSPILRNIKLLEFKDSKDSVSGEITQSFIFTAEANFNYQTKEGLALVDSLTKDDDKPEGKAQQ